MLTYKLQVKQEKGLQKQDFCWKLTFSGYPSGKGHLHQRSLNVLTVQETVYAERFPWGLPLLNMHFNPVPRMTFAFISATFYLCIFFSHQHFHLELKEARTNWPFFSSSRIIRQMFLCFQRPRVAAGHRGRQWARESWPPFLLLP